MPANITKIPYISLAIAGPHDEKSTVTLTVDMGENRFLEESVEPNWPSLALEQLFGSTGVTGELNRQAGFPKEPKQTARMAGKYKFPHLGPGSKIFWRE